MRKYLFVGCGGFLGALLRYWVKGLSLGQLPEVIPLHTLGINVLGAFLIALISTVAYEVWEFDGDLRLGLTTGLLGAFTTFSTLCKETVNLWRAGEENLALSYVGLSISLGLLAAFAGVVLARGLGLLRQRD